MPSTPSSSHRGTSHTKVLASTILEHALMNECQTPHPSPKPSPTPPPAPTPGTSHAKVLASTIPENAAMMHELLGVTEQRFKPSIPNLVYQYSLYTNYESAGLGVENPEIPAEDS